MNTPPTTDSDIRTNTGYESVRTELTIAETLRVLEVARGIRQERMQAEVALARNEFREVMRKRLMDAATITGDTITEADVDDAIEQYLSTQNSYADPPFSLTIFLAHVYVRRVQIIMILSAALALYAIWRFMS